MHECHIFSILISVSTRYQLVEFCSMIIHVIVVNTMSFVCARVTGLFFLFFFIFYFLYIYFLTFYIYFNFLNLSFLPF